MRTPSSIALAHLAGLALAVAGGASGASAQNALGDGRALDANLNVRGTRNLPKADFRQELSLRNSIVTGNAPGGLSFRGDVGYAAPGEFRGELGSDDLFAFRRDSVYSGLGGQGIRGTSALQYQFALTTGSTPPQNLFGTRAAEVPGAFVGRDEAGTPGFGYTPPTRANAAGGFGVGAAPRQLDLRADSQTDSLRSIGSHTASRGLQASLLGTFKVDQFGQQTYGVAASDLRGLRAAPMREGEGDQEARPATAAPTTASNRVNLALDRIGSPTGIDAGAIGGDAGELGARGLQDLRSPSTAYDQVVARVRARAESALASSGAAAPDEPETWWQEQLRILREQLLVAPETLAVPGTATGTGTGGALGAGADADDADAVPTGPRDAVDLLRDSGAPVSTLVEGITEDDAYAGHMRVGQDELAAGRYFNAEERFTRALTVKNKDVTAQIGRVHAQLGAGLFISAALNMRQVFLEQPEVVMTRYAPGLMPGAARLTDLATVLRQNIGAEARGDGMLLADVRLERESGLLLAYIGWQTSDAAMTAQGLAAARRTLTSDARPSDADGLDLRLISLLERAWRADAPGGG